MTAFFLTQGLLTSVVEPAAETLLFGPPAQRKALEARSRSYRIARRLHTVFLSFLLTEAFWWPPFTQTQLDTRLLREWVGWGKDTLAFARGVVHA